MEEPATGVAKPAAGSAEDVPCEEQTAEEDFPQEWLEEQLPDEWADVQRAMFGSLCESALLAVLPYHCLCQAELVEVLHYLVTSKYLRVRAGTLPWVQALVAKLIQCDGKSHHKA